LYSGILAKSSSAAFVSTLAGESGKWNGIHVSPSETFRPTLAFAVISPLRLMTFTVSPFAIPSLSAFAIL
jgi:hypothetical protein